MFEGGKGLDYNCFVPSLPCTKSAQKPKAEKHAEATYGTEYANPHPLLKERKADCSQSVNCPRVMGCIRVSFKVAICNSWSWIRFSASLDQLPARNSPRIFDSFLGYCPQLRHFHLYHWHPQEENQHHEGRPHCPVSVSALSSVLPGPKPVVPGPVEKYKQLPWI